MADSASKGWWCTWPTGREVRSNSEGETWSGSYAYALAYRSSGGCYYRRGRVCRVPGMGNMKEWDSTVGQELLHVSESFSDGLLPVGLTYARHKHMVLYEPHPRRVIARMPFIRSSMGRLNIDRKGTYLPNLLEMMNVYQSSLDYQMTCTCSCFVNLPPSDSSLPRYGPVVSTKISHPSHGRLERHAEPIAGQSRRAPGEKVTGDTSKTVPICPICSPPSAHLPLSSRTPRAG